MNKYLKNILIATGIVSSTAALGAIYYASAKQFMKIALDREEPKQITKGKDIISGSEEISKIAATVMDAAAKLENMGFEEIHIQSHDGIDLVGHWYCPKSPKRVIVAMHGWRSSWSQDFALISPFWMENNCAVLYAEQRGQGSSGGEYMGFGLLERHDCLRWINWANEKTESKYPVYLGGISMGATTILMTSGFDLPKNVKGIVADCGFTSPHAIWRHVAKNNLHIPYGMYSAIANDLCKKKIQVGADEYSCIDALKNSTVPVLFIHGTDDKFVPVEMTYENYKACVSPKKLLIVPGAEHGMSYLVDKESYEEAVKNFWNENET